MFPAFFQYIPTADSFGQVWHNDGQMLSEGRTMKNTKLKLAVLMISMLQPIIGAANSVLSEIRKAFGSISESSVQQLVSIPFLVTVPATILAGRLSLRFPKKKLLLFGIGLTTAAGLFPVFVHDFTLIFISRLFVGVGVGFVIPFMTGLIADFFHGHERDHLFGLQGTAVNLGAVLFFLIGGILGGINWHYNFLVFLIGIIIFPMVLLFLPEQKTAEPQAQKNEPFIKKIFFICLAMLGIHTIANTFSLNLSFVIAESRIGDASITGTIIAFTSLGGLLTGLLYQRILDLARRFVVAIAIFLLAAGLFIASLSYSIALMIVAAFFVGCGSALIVAAYLTKISDRVSGQSRTVAMAFLLAAVSIGVFVSPIYTMLIKLLPFFTQSRSIFSIGSITLAVFGLGSVIFTKVRPS
jgi:MFS family permease